MGAFKGEDKILLINKDGDAKVVIPELSLHFDDKLICIEKWKPNKPITAVYYDGEKQRYFIKRFLIESESKEGRFIKPEGELIFLNTDWRPLITVNFVKPRDKDPILPMEINTEEFITVKGFKALGNQLSQQKIKNIELKKALPYDDEEKSVEEIEVNDQEELSADDDSQIKLNL